MFRREMKVNFKSFMIWLFIVMGMFTVVFLIYPSIIDSDSIQKIDDLIKIFPEEVLKTFNMDISSLDSAYGWLKSEGFVFILLIVGCYAGILGSNILLKEENDKTIEYLNSLPVKRSDIVIQKVLAGLLYIVLLVIGIGIFNFIGLSLSGDFEQKQYLFLSITPLFPAIVIYFICMFFSTFTHKSKKMIGVSLGIVFISYMLYMLSTISDSVSFLKYFSAFTLSDIRNVITSISIDPVMLALSIGISILFFMMILIRYNKKELIG